MSLELASQEAGSSDLEVAGAVCADKAKERETRARREALENISIKMWGEKMKVDKMKDNA